MAHPKSGDRTNEPFRPSTAAKKAAANLKKLGFHPFDVKASEADLTFKRLEQKLLHKQPLGLVEQVDLRALYREHARLSQLLRRVSGQANIYGFQSARALFAQTVRNTEWISGFHADIFRHLAATAPQFPILVTPGDPPKMLTQSEAKLARAYREEVPQRVKRSKVKQDAYAHIAADALWLMDLRRVQVSKEEWPTMTKLIRNTILKEVVNEETLDSLVRPGKRPISKRRDRVVETILRRMKGMLGY